MSEKSAIEINALTLISYIVFRGKNEMATGKLENKLVFFKPTKHLTKKGLASRAKPIQLRIEKEGNFSFIRLFGALFFHFSFSLLLITRSVVEIF